MVPPGRLATSRQQTAFRSSSRIFAAALRSSSLVILQNPIHANILSNAVRDLIGAAQPQRRAHSGMVLYGLSKILSVNHHISK